MDEYWAPSPGLLRAVLVGAAVALGCALEFAALYMANLSQPISPVWVVAAILLGAPFLGGGAGIILWDDAHPDGGESSAPPRADKAHDTVTTLTLAYKMSRFLEDKEVLVKTMVDGEASYLRFPPFFFSKLPTLGDRILVTVENQGHCFDKEAFSEREVCNVKPEFSEHEV